MQKLQALITGQLIYLLLLFFLLSCINANSLMIQQKVAVVTFSVTGIGVDVPLDAVVLRVDDVDYRVADLPANFTWEVGSWHSYQWVDFIPSITEGKRYAWQSTSGIVSAMGGVIVVPENGGIVIADYKVQYQWIATVEGLGPDAIGTPLSVDGMYIPTDMLPFTFWWDENSQHVYCFAELISSTIGYKRYANHDSGCFNLVVTSPGVLSRSYHVEYRVYIWVGRGNGTTEPPPGEYWVDNGTYVYVKAIPEQGYTFEEWSHIFAECSTYNRYSNPTEMFVCGQISLRANFREVKPFDFNVRIEPSNVYVYKGGSVIIGVVVLSEGEPPQVVSLSVIGAPKGVSYAFNVESAIPPLSTTLIITVSEEARAGSYTLILAATSGDITKRYSFVLTILEREKPWYTQPPVIAVVVIIVLVAILVLILRRRH